MLKTAMIFTDQMVLQREKKIPVWGTAEPGAKVSIRLDGLCGEATADETGTWKVELPPHAAGTSYEMVISSGEETITLVDICVGEVWIAGGQSNMEFLLGFEAHIDEVLAGDMMPGLRFFDYPEVAYEGQLEDYNYCHEGFWRGCTVQDLPYFSAVGYYFGKNIGAALDVPVGIIGCNWGGTPACAWMDRKYLEGTEGEAWVDEYEEAVKDLDLEAYERDFLANPANDRTHELEKPEMELLMKIGLTPEQQIKFMEVNSVAPLPMGPRYERRPGGLYETMLKKVHPFAVRGAIWYQGETDADYHAAAYTAVFSQMIRCWRELWQEELPFLFVQLAPFRRWLSCNGLNYPVTRACQEQVSRTVPGTWMASIGDVGMEWDIHPKNKLPVGERLALLARGHVYGEALLCDAPEFVSAEKCGEEIVVSFAHAEGLHLADDALQAMVGVTAAGAEETLGGCVRDGQLILQNAADVTELRFAWADYYEVNLYNGAGIPAMPFKAKL